MRKFLLPILVSISVLFLLAIHPNATYAAGPPAPNLKPPQCNTDGTVTLSWDAVFHAAKYTIRIDNRSNILPLQCGGSAPNDFCDDNVYATQYTTYRPTQNQKYIWWLNTVGDDTYAFATGDSSQTGEFTCGTTQPPVTEPRLIVDPSVPTIDKAITLKASGCPPSLSKGAGFVWKLDLAPGNLGSEQANTDGSGNASFQIPAHTLLQNKYLAYLTCGGVTTKPVPFIVGESTPVDLKKTAEERADGVIESGEKITIQATGCPKDALVEFRWDSSGTFLTANRSQRVQADGSGKADFINAYSVGNVYLDAHCFVDNQEKAKSGVMQFVVLQARPTLIPTQPSPPPPVCDHFDNNGTCTRVNTAIGPINTNAGEFVISVFTVILSLSGGVALLIIMYAGYVYLTSRGNPEKVQQGREMLVSALVGFLFIIFSFVIMETITGDILHLPGFARSFFGTTCNDPSCASHP